jgi:hypothetical protein
MMHPALVISARLGVEKRAASLADLAAKGGRALGKGVGGALGTNTAAMLRYAPTALGALGGAYVGSKRPDMLGSDEEPTKAQRIRGALVGGLAGAGAAHLSGVGSGLAQDFASRAARLAPLGQDRAAATALGQMGAGAGRFVGSIPGQVGSAVAGAGRVVGRTITHPVESAKNIAQAAVDPIRSAIRDPSSIPRSVVEQASNPVSAAFLGLSAYDAARNISTAEDPMTGRHRGLGERVLGSAGNLAGGLAYGAYGGPASANNPLTRFVGQTLGGVAINRGAASVGRGIDRLVSGPQAKAPTPQGTPE